MLDSFVIVIPSYIFRMECWNVSLYVDGTCDVGKVPGQGGGWC
jgi:hypothetical protein